MPIHYSINNPTWSSTLRAERPDILESKVLQLSIDLVEDAFIPDFTLGDDADFGVENFIIHRFLKYN